MRGAFFVANRFEKTREFVPRGACRPADPEPRIQKNAQKQDVHIGKVRSVVMHRLPVGKVSSYSRAQSAKTNCLVGGYEK